MGTTAKSRARFRPLPGRGLLDDEIELGRVVGVFGVRGEVRVHLHNREASVLLDGPRVVTLVSPDGARSATRLSCRSGAGKRILGRLDGLDDRDVAASLKGTRIGLARAALPEPSEGEFYVADLQGLPVRIDGAPRGRVVDVHHLPTGDVMELDIDGEALFLPFADPALDIDLASGHVRLGAEVLDELEDDDG